MRAAPAAQVGNGFRHGSPGRRLPFPQSTDLHACPPPNGRAPGPLAAPALTQSREGFSSLVEGTTGRPHEWLDQVAPAQWPGHPGRTCRPLSLPLRLLLLSQAWPRVPVGSGDTRGAQRRSATSWGTWALLARAPGPRLGGGRGPSGGSASCPCPLLLWGSCGSAAPAARFSCSSRPPRSSPR